MSLNIASLLIVYALTTFVAETSIGLFIEPTMDSVSEAQDPKENDENIVTESQKFEEEWKKFHAMEVSFIGRYDPNSSIEGEDIKRSISRRLNKREVRKPFNRIKGCNKLPIPPYYSSGECQHRDEIAKCWVSCHMYYRYLDNAKEKVLFCLDGDWKPEKIPDCVPEMSFFLCEDTYISGNNMNVTCAEDGEMMKCTATCVSSFRFQDGETVKVITCETVKGVHISRISFPDCDSV